jgi:hypothetical protein
MHASLGETRQRTMVIAINRKCQSKRDFVQVKFAATWLANLAKAQAKNITGTSGWESTPFGWYVRQHLARLGRNTR